MLEWIVSSTVLILVIVALRALLRGRISLRLQYALWGLVLVRLLVPWNLPAHEISVQNVVIQAPVEEMAQYRLPARSYEEAYTQVVESYESQGVPMEGIDPVTLDNQTTERMRSDFTLGQALTVLWALGAVGVLAFILWSNHLFRRKLRRDRVRQEVSWVSLPVYVSAGLETPCIFGLFRPAIYLTADMAGDETRMRHILEHEMTHYFHGDHVTAPLRCLALALHWFNPLVWWAVKLSRKDCELACDEGTIHRLGEGERMEYGRTLIRLTCERNPSRDYVLAATTMLSDQNTIKERIVMIAKKPKTAFYTLIAVVLIAAFAVGCTFTGPTQEPEEPARTPGHTVELSIPEATGLPQELYPQIREKLTEDIRSRYPESDVTANITNIIWAAEQINHFVYRVEYDLTVDGESTNGECLVALRFRPFAGEHWVLLDSYDPQEDPKSVALEVWRKWYLSEEPVPVEQIGEDPGTALLFPAGVNGDQSFQIMEVLADRCRLAFAEGAAGGIITELTQKNIGEELPNLRMYQMDYYLVSPEGAAYPVTEYVVFLYNLGEDEPWKLLGLLSREDGQDLAGDFAAGAESFLTTQELRQLATDRIDHINSEVEEILNRVNAQETVSISWSEDEITRYRPGVWVQPLGRLSRDFDWLPADGQAQTGGPSLTITAGELSLTVRSGSDILECREGETSRFYRAIQLKEESLYEGAMRSYDQAHFTSDITFQVSDSQDVLDRFLTQVLPIRHLQARPESWYRGEEVRVLENTLYEETGERISGIVRYALRQEELSRMGYGNVREGEGEYEGWLIISTDYTLERISGDSWLYRVS